MRIRSTLVRIHLWVGLVAAPVLLILGITGAMLVVEQPVTDRLDAKTSLVTPSGTMRQPSELLASVQRAYPGAQLAAMQLPQSADHSITLTVTVPSDERAETLIVDPYTGRVLGVQPEQPTVYRKVRELHRRLLMGERGNLVIMWITGALGFLALTGPVVWWPRRRIGVRWEQRGWRRLLDMHSVLGIVSCASLFLFSVTGLVVHLDAAVQKWVGALTGAPAPHEPRGLEISGCEPGSRLDVDRLVAAGVAALPGARPTYFMLPDSPKSPARLWLKYPEDRTPNGRSIMLLNPCTGRSQFTIDTRSAPLAYLYPREWNREIHTGDIFGWPTRVLAFVFCIALVAMAATGPAVWLMRRRSA